MVPSELNGDRRATAWMSSAGCAQDADPDIFFPAAGGITEEAKTVCRGCPVHRECLAYAVVHGIEDGVWGGASEEERRAIRRQPTAPLNRSARRCAPPEPRGPGCPLAA